MMHVPKLENWRKNKMVEAKLREIMEDYNIQMILFVHPDLGTVQLNEKKTVYWGGRKHKTERDLSKLVSKLEEKVINEDYEDLLLLIRKIKEVL